MKLVESILTKNPCYTAGRKITVKGLMLHSVGCPQPSAQVFVKNWNSVGCDRACVHGFIDGNDGTIYQCLPWNHRGWHCGASGNNTHIGVEMCEPACIKYTGGATFICSDKATAQAVAKRTYEAAVELFAMLCQKFSLNSLGDGVIVSHKEGRKRGIASNHGDPEHLWMQLGLPYTMDTFRSAVKAAMGGGVAVPSGVSGTKIMGAAVATADQMKAYLKAKNPKVAQSVLDMVPLYLSEGAAEGVRGDIAFAQSCLETGNGSEIIINAAAVAELEKIAAQTSEAVESSLVSGGVSTARVLSNTVTLTTTATGKITIKIDPDILTTKVDKIRVETPTYAITLNVEDLRADLTSVLTFTAQDVTNSGSYSMGHSALLAAEGVSGLGPAPVVARAYSTTIELGMPSGKTTNPVTISLPTNSGSTTYQAVVKTDGSSVSSKYNPATTKMDGKVTTSGSYTVQTNEKDFTDISGKSAEMQKAIRYLASKGIITGTSDTKFSPDGSISRAEVTALLVRALGWTDNSAKPTFKDVAQKNWYYSVVGVGQKRGLINGFNDNTFRGNTSISKVQILAMASRVLKTEMGYREPSNPTSYLGRYKDGVTGWAQPEIALATKENLVVFRTDGTFKGSGNMTRGDAAIIIYRLFQRIW